jgi:hypothetical protein
MFLRGPCREVILKTNGATNSVSFQLIVSSVQQSVKRGLEPEAEEEPLLGPLPGNI